jgi:thiamine pyrophosphokinase
MGTNFNLTQFAGNGPFALVILNRSIEPSEKFTDLWMGSRFRVVADGAANHLYNLSMKNPAMDIIIHVIGGLDGRFDHTLSAINTLCIFKEYRIQIHNGDSTVFLLVSGSNKITGVIGNSCGLFPLYGGTFVKTSGLKWNMEGEIEYGGLVSSSNVIIDEVTIECNHPVVFIHNNS